MTDDELKAKWREYNKKYYQKHKEEVKRKQKCRDKQKKKNEYDKQYYQEHKKEFSEYYKKYYQEHKEMSCKHKYTFWLKKIVELSEQIKQLEDQRDNALVQFENSVPVDVWNYIVDDIGSTLKNYKKQEKNNDI